MYGIFRANEKTVGIIFQHLETKKKQLLIQ